MIATLHVIVIILAKLLIAVDTNLYTTLHCVEASLQSVVRPSGNKLSAVFEVRQNPRCLGANLVIGTEDSQYFSDVRLWLGDDFGHRRDFVGRHVAIASGFVFFVFGRRGKRK